MAGGELTFDTGLLHNGSDSSEFAAAAARKAAACLSRAIVPKGMFGDFSAAEGFHTAARAALNSHTQRLQEHHARLTDIAAKGHSSARALSATDADSAQAIGNAGDQLGDSVT
jgi:hypothetical protein